MCLLQGLPDTPHVNLDPLVEESRSGDDERVGQGRGVAEGVWRREGGVSGVSRNITFVVMITLKEKPSI